MNKKSLKINYVFNTMLNIMNIIFPLITFPYISRVLSPEGLGKVNFSSSYISYFLLIAGLGISDYAIREGAKVRDNREKLSKLASEMMILNIISSMLSLILLVISLNYIDMENYYSLLVIYSFPIITNTFSFTWIFPVLEEYKYITIRSFLLQLVGVICIFTFIHEEADYYKYAIINVGITCLTTIINFNHAKKYIDLFKQKKYEVKKHISSVLIIFGISVSATIYLNSDITILGLMKSDKVVGEYSAVVKLNRILITLISSLSTVMLPRVSYYVSNGRINEYKNLIKKGINFIFLFAIPCVVGIILLSKEIIIIIAGYQYVEAHFALKIIAFNVLVSPLAGFISYQILMPFNKEKYFFIATFASCIFNVVTNILLIPQYSLCAAAFTTVFSEIITISFGMYISRHLIDMKFILKDIYQYILAVIPFYPIILLLKSCVENIFIVTLSCTISCAGVYVFVLIICKNSMIAELLDTIKQLLRTFKIRFTKNNL